MIWINTTVGEYAPFVYGKGLPKTKREHGHIPVYGSNGCVGFHNESYIKTPGIIIGRKGSVGAVHLSNTPFWPIDTSFYVIKDSTDELKYIYYLLKSLGLESMNSDSAVPGLNRDNAHAIPIRIPKTKKERELVGNWISKFDDKININTQTNETLEQLSQAIFKSWFVDFDPVKAKANLKEKLAIEGGDWEGGLTEIAAELGMSKEVLALFPDEFDESELGLIPKGWRVKALDKIAHYQNGLALQKFRPEDENDFLPVVKISQLKKGFADGKEKASPNIKSECIIDNGDVIFSWSGSLMVDIWCGGRAALNQHLFKVTSDECPKWFYLFYTKHHLEQFQRIASDKAVTMGHIKREHLNQALCAVPNETLLKKISKFIEHNIQKSIDLRLENQTLTQLRDTLLPKLLSGEITINGTGAEINKAVQ